MKATTLSCPQCGAGLGHGQSNCGHCGSSIVLSEADGQLVSLDSVCPNCGRKCLTEDKHCGSCGSGLISQCPNKQCIQENSVWRKFCKKCGVDMFGYRVDTALKDQKRIGRKIAEHEEALESIKRKLPASRSRERALKYIIFFGGTFTALALISSGEGGAIFWGVVVEIIAVIWAKSFSSEEVDNLVNSWSLHSEDLERLLAKGDEAERELVSLAASDAPLSGPE